MSLRRRTMLATILSVALILVTLIVAYRVIVSRAYQDLEQQAVAEELEKAASVLRSEVRALDVLLTDWAAWDDTYSFVNTRDPRFVASNVPAELLDQIHLNLVIIRNSGGLNLVARAQDGDGKAIVLPGLTDRIDDASPLLKPSAEGHVSGLIKTIAGPMLISARPVTMSDGSGPPRGFVLMGRFLDGSVSERVAEVLNVVVTVADVDDASLPAAVQSALPALIEDGSVTTPAAEGRIAAYRYLRDLSGTPLAVLGVEIDRTILQQSGATLRALLVAIAATGVVLVGVLTFAIDVTVVRRLRRLRAEMERIGSGNDPGGATARATVDAGRDEVADVAAGINDMLDRLDLAAQERTRLVEAVAEQRDLSVDAFRQMGEGIIVLDALGRCTGCNPAAAHLLDRDTATIVGRLWSEVLPDLVPADDATRSAGEEMSRVGNRTIAVSRATDTGNRPSVIVLRDVSGVYDVEALKRDLVATVSHELRTPLTAIRATVGLLRETSAGELSEVQQRLVSLLESNTGRLWMLVDDLLDMAALEGGRVALYREPGYLDAICERVLEDLQGSAAAAGVRLVSDLGDVEAAFVDAGRMRQVIENLVSNAIKFTPPGGTVEVRTNGDAGHVRVQVRDTGIGIDRADLGRIFEKFYRTRKASAFARGTGLGLSIAKSIVDLHGGRLFAESDGEHGTTMTIELAIAPVPEFSVLLDDDGTSMTMPVAEIGSEPSSPRG